MAVHRGGRDCRVPGLLGVRPCPTQQADHGRGPLGQRGRVGEARPRRRRPQFDSADERRQGQAAPGQRRRRHAIERSQTSTATSRGVITSAGDKEDAIAGEGRSGNTVDPRPGEILSLVSATLILYVLLFT
jgi:hypothetical protein